ncbi:MAG: FHA domain-containing protein [Planctomycetes bacterium]|nr:FHA domain-containing protein [Planctomycetota bacterium]
METLVFLNGINQGQRIPMSRPVIRLGRERHNDVRVDDDGVSRSHAEISRRGDKLILRDLGSTNGTFLNDTRVDEAVLSDGDRVIIGDTVLLFQVVDDRREKGLISFNADAERVTARMRLSTMEMPTPSEKRSAQDFRSLSSFIYDAMPLASLGRLADMVLEHMMSSTSCSRAIFLLSDKDGELRTEAVKTRDIDHAAGEIGVSRTITNYVLQTNEALLATDPARDSRFKDTTVIRKHQVSSIIAIPLRVREKTLGLLYLDTVGVATPLTEESLRLVTAMALPAAFAIDNTRLYQELTDSIELSHGILRALVSGILVIGSDSRIRQVNQAAVDILRMRPKDLVGHDIHEIPNIASLARLLDRALEEGVTTDQGEILISSGVEEIPIGVTTSLLGTDRDTTMGVVASFRNLSEIKLLSERVQMSEHLAALGEMAAGIAHEVRNPLNSIRGFASLLQERVQDEKTGQFASIIIEEVDRMNALVQDLLDFARHRELEMSDIPLKPFIDEIVVEVSQQIDSGAVSLSVDVPPDIPDVWGNADRLKQVLLNMLRNAVEAMPEGGSVSIAARTDDTPSGREIVLSIADTGVGIPPEILPKIFTPFFSKKDKGTGLGLAISQKIVKQHQGRIEVESAAGRGTTFRIHLLPAGSRRRGSG